jgi:multicomponent Na+:H+ antiporter subunit F
MAELLTGAAALIILSALVGLARVLRGPTRADRLLAAQLLSTAGIGALLLLAAAGAPALIDVALVLALVGAFASVAFVMASRVIERR